MAADLNLTLNGTPVPVYLGENTAEAARQAELAGEYAQQAEGAAATVLGMIKPRKNLADPSLIQAGMRIASGTNIIQTSTVFRSIAFVPVTEGEEYTISGIENGMRAGFVPSPELGQTATGIGTFSAVAGSLTLTATDPYLFVEMTNDGTGDTTYDGTIQIEHGDQRTAYEPYSLGIPQDEVTDLEADLAARPERSEILEDWSYNKIDPAAVDFTLRYTNGTQSIVTAGANKTALSDFIPVKEGRFYVVSGAIFNPTTPQAGFFANADATVAIQNIIWGDPPSGPGKIFQVPEGLGIEGMRITLATNDDKDQLAGNVQLEEGEVATAWRAYSSSVRVIPELISVTGGGDGGGGEFNDAAWLGYVRGESQPYLRERWPVFTKHALLKDKDLCVLSTGTSLTARSTEHHTDHPDAAHRPPLMHSNNLASHIWDRLAALFPGQKYARYDDTDYITEGSGTWATSHNLSEWDDGSYRNGLTRYSESDGASVSFTIPAGTWAWRFIHRTDSVASEVIGVAIAGGDDLVEVYDENTSSWIEANGYSFSQREAAASGRTVSIPHADTSDNEFVNQSITTKGNTTYQKRLKFRVLDRESDIAITFTNADSSTRFNYWGAEWSFRQYMITYINAARGSHHTRAEASGGLPRFADNEVHSFKPDLIFGELPIHNDGAAGISVSDTWDRWGRLTDNYLWNEDYELSLKTRAAYYGYTPEFGFWTPSIAYNFGGIGEDGQLLYSVQNDGVPMTALDKFDQAVAWAREHHPEAVVIHAVRRWVEAGFAIYGDLKTATTGSSKGGLTMTNDGSHPNDVGDAILAKLVVGPLDFAA